MPRLFALLLLVAAVPAAAQRVRVVLPASAAAQDGRLILLVAPADRPAEPRFQVEAGVNSAQVFGLDVTDWRPGTARTFDDAAVRAGAAVGHPLDRLAQIPAGTYVVQAVLNRYETFRLQTGHTVLLPPDRGEGQQWNRKPGNLYAAPQRVRVAPGTTLTLRLDQTIPEIAPPSDTDWIKHITIRSERLSRFYGRPMTLGAHVLLPKGWADHPEARYPLVVNHGHFPADFDGFRTTPPDTTFPCVPSARFGEPCYNRIVEQEAYRFYQHWTSRDFPRMLIVEIQHPTPYYDDSYAVNSASQGPWGDAIMYELIPEIERRFRGLGQGWARFTYGGSTGGWEALAVQMFYPDAFNGAFVACPDPVDFRAYELVNLYDDANAYFDAGPFGRVERPAHRDSLGRVAYTVRDENRMEHALGTRSRSGGQWDIWEATFSPQGPDGYPVRIWDKRTGAIRPDVAAYWREHYDLRYRLERDWATLAPQLRGKLHVYVGDMDNYYLNDAVYRLHDFLRTANPPADATVAYGDRDEHCWNGDPNLPNGISRLRYHTMYVPRILERIREAAPPGADTTSWRY